MSEMFHTARIFCRPVKPPRLMLCDTVAPGCWPLPLTTPTRVLPIQYSQLLVACRAVLTQVKVSELPTEVAGQPRLSSLRTANWAIPALQLRRPLGPSTLCGSYLIWPQSGTRPCAQSACRLGGAET